MIQSLILAGGCFWCVEHDIHEAHGVTSVTSGYSGGADIHDIQSEHTNTPTYEDHTGYKESVLVEYDDTKTSYKKVLQCFIDHIDPTDDGGQFGDRGESYRTAIFYENNEEKVIAEKVLKELNDSRVYDTASKVDILKRTHFFKAEEYHQNYADKNPTRYALYRNGSGREGFVTKTCAIRDEKNIQWSE